MNTNEALEILELDENSTQLEIKESYKLLMKVWHPDRFINDAKLSKKATLKTQKINNAYQVLKNYKNEYSQPRVKKDNPFVMVFVKGGTFEMGSNEGNEDEKPIHTVILSDFYIGATEVTQAQWVAIMGHNPSKWKGDNLPVEEVSWDDIQLFLKKLNLQTGQTYRLPTEAEWEYAARGGSEASQTSYQYAGSNTLGEVAWYGDNSGGTTHPVGQKKPNALGLYDMSGNVWEWCNDYYDSNYYQNSPTKNPQGSLSGHFRILRGGSWSHDSQNCRVARRLWFFPNYWVSRSGFRLVRVVSSQ